MVDVDPPLISLIGWNTIPSHRSTPLKWWSQICPNVPYLVANYPRIVGGWTNPGDFNGISGGKSSTYIWGELTYFLSGMNHQVLNHGMEWLFCSFWLTDWSRQGMVKRRWRRSLVTKCYLSKTRRGDEDINWTSMASMTINRYQQISTASVLFEGLF